MKNSWIFFLSFLLLFSFLAGSLQAKSLLDFQRGENLEEKLASLSLKDPQDYLEGALILAKLGHTKELEELCQEALTSFPRNNQLKEDLAELYQELGWRQKAIDLYTRLLGPESQESAQYCLTISNLYWQLGEADLALEYGLRALAFVPSWENYQRLAADYFPLAKVCAMKEEEFFQQALALLPQEIRLQQAWAQYLESKGQEQEACSIYWQIQEIEPFHPSYHDYFRLLKKLDQAKIETLLVQGGQSLDYLLAGLYQYELAKGPYRHQPEKYLERAKNYFSDWSERLADRDLANLLLADFLHSWGDYSWAQDLYLGEYLKAQAEDIKGSALLGLARSFREGGITPAFLAWPQEENQALLNIVSGFLSLAMDRQAWLKMKKDWSQVQQDYLGLILALEIYDYYLENYSCPETRSSVYLEKLEILFQLERQEEFFVLAQEALNKVHEKEKKAIYRLEAKIRANNEEHLLAAESYRKILALDLSEKEAWEIFALLIQQYSLVNEFQAAREAYRKEALLRTDDIRFWYDYANFERVRFQNELAIYEEMLDYFPLDLSLIAILAREYEVHKEEEKMLDLLYLGAVLDNNLAKEYLAQLMRLGLFEKKEKDLQKEKQPEAWKLLGDMALHLSQPRLALDYYEKYLDFAPNHLTVLERYAHLARSLELWDKASKAFSKLQYYKFNDPQVRLVRGEVLIEEGKLEEAHLVWRSVLAIHPLDANMYLEAADLFYDYYFNQEARAIIKEARVRLKEPSLAALEMGALWEEDQEWTQAFQEYLKLIQGGKMTYHDRSFLQEHFISLASLGKLPLLKEAFMASFEEGAQLSLYLFSADFYWALKEEDEGQAVLALAGEKDLTKLEFLELASYWRKFKRPREEEACLHKAWQIYGDEEDLLLALARNYRENDLKAELSYILAKLYALKASNYREEYLGVLLNLEDYARVQELLTEAIKKEPQKASLYTRRAEAYQKAGEDDLALEAFDQALELARASGQLEEITAVYLSRAQGQIKWGDLISAREEYLQALNRQPLNSRLLHQIYLALEEINQLEAFFAYYEKTAKDAPRDYRWQMLLARANRYRGNYEERLAALTRASSLEPHRHDLKEYLAWEEWRAGNLDKALQAYGSLLEAKKDDAGKRKEILENMLALNLELGKLEQAQRIFSELLPENTDNRYILIDWAHKAIDYGFLSQGEDLISLVEEKVSLEERPYFYSLTEAQIKLALAKGQAKDLLKDLEYINSYELVKFAGHREVYGLFKEKLHEEALLNFDSKVKGQKYLDLVLKKGDWRAAVDFLENMLELNPEDFSHYISLAKIYKERHLYSDLKRLALRASDAHPWQEEAYLWLVECLLNDGQKEEAFKLATIIPELSILSQESYLPLVKLWKDYGHYEQALTYLDLAGQLGGDRENLAKEKVLLYLLKGEKEHGTKLLEDYLVEYSQDPYGALNISRELAQLEEFNLALKAFQISLMVAQKVDSSSFPLYYQVNEQRKILYGELALNEETWQFYEEMKEKDLTSWQKNDLAVNVAEIFLTLEDWPRLLLVAKEAYKEASQDDRLFKYLILALVEEGEEREALKILKRRHLEEPENKAVYLEYADLLHELGHYEQAVKILEDMLANYPRQNGPLEEALKRFLAWGYPQGATTKLEELLALEPTNRGLRRLFIESCLANNQLALGLDNLDLLLKMTYDPYNEGYLIRLGVALRKAGGQIDKRLEELALVQEKGAHLLLEGALLVYEQGEKEKAWLILEQALEEFPLEIVLYPTAVQLARELEKLEEEEALLKQLLVMDPQNGQWYREHMEWLVKEEASYSISNWQFDTMGGDWR